MGARRAIAYAVLILMSFLCIVWFFILFINATRSKGELARGFTFVPSTHLIENMKDGDVVLLENTRYHKEEQAKRKQKDGEDDIQKLTDKFIKEIDGYVSEKEQEVLSL